MAIPFVLFSTLGFLAGAAFNHYVAFPFIMAFFASFNSVDLRVHAEARRRVRPVHEDAARHRHRLPDADRRCSSSPRCGWSRRGSWRRNFKYALLLIFIIAAVITPTGDPMTQTIFAAPMSCSTASASSWRGWSVPSGSPPRTNPSLPPQAAARRVELRRTYTSTPKFVVIRASSGKEVMALVGDLSSPSAVMRDGAVARLTVIGARAVQRLLDVARTATASPVARAAAFRALEAIAEPRALATALAATSRSGSGRRDARHSASRACSSRIRQACSILDHVTVIALDRQRNRDVRLAAIRALSELEPDTIQPIATELEADPDSEIANALKPPPRRKSVSQVERLNEAAAGTMADDPAALRRALARSGAGPVAVGASPNRRARARDGKARTIRREEASGWPSARPLTLALAHRGSRLATLRSAGYRQPRQGTDCRRVPVCDDGDWRKQLPRTDRHGVRPCQVRRAAGRMVAHPSRRHVPRDRRPRATDAQSSAMKKIEKRWPGLLDELMASKSRPKPKAQSLKPSD